jgi:hypothetical protein
MEGDAFESNGLLGFSGDEGMMGIEVQETTEPQMDRDAQETENPTQSVDPETGPRKPTESLLADDPFTSNGLLFNLSLPQLQPSPSIQADDTVDLDVESSTSTTTLHPKTPPRISTRRLREPILEPSLPEWKPPMEGRTSTGKVIQFPRRRRPILTGENVSFFFVKFSESYV